MASNPDIKVITGIKLEYLSEKQNDYGCNHMFQVLDESPLKELIELEDMNKPIWEYNGKCYLKINAVKVEGLPVDTVLKKGNPYFIDLTFSRYDFEKKGEQLTGYSISEINEIN